MKNAEKEDYEIAMGIIRRLRQLPYSPENLLTDWAKSEYTQCVLDAADLLSDQRRRRQAVDEGRKT